MNSAFINYPFVTMWISLCLFLSPSSSSLILQNIYIIANHLLYLQRWFFLNKRLLFIFDCHTILIIAFSESKICARYSVSALTAKLQSLSSLRVAADFFFLLNPLFQKQTFWEMHVLAFLVRVSRSIQHVCTENMKLQLADSQLNWKQGQTDGLALSRGNKVLIPGSLKLTN